MTKEVREIIRMLFAFGSLYWFFMHSSKNWIIFFVILTAIAIIPELLPKKKKTSKKKSQSQQKSPSQSKKKNATTQQKIPHNLLRSDNEILTIPLEELSWREFERLCYLYYKAKGFKPKETSEGADGGVDLIIFDKRHNANVAVQIKHYKSGNQIKVEPIRELNSAKRNHNCALANFITTSTFTNEALKQADKFKIETHDKHWVESKILKWRDQEVSKRKLA